MKPALLIVLLLVACGQKTELPDCTPEAKQYLLEAGKTMQIDTFTITNTDTTYERYAYQVREGANFVFTYLHQFEECREIADDEQVDKLVFEITAAATAVKWEDSTAFRQAKAFYHQIGAWGTTPMLITSGTLEGQKITNNRWHINASLRTPGINRTLNFDHDFMP